MAEFYQITDDHMSAHNFEIRLNQGRNLVEIHVDFANRFELDPTCENMLKSMLKSD